MKELSIQRNLTDSTRKQSIWIRNTDGDIAVYSLHITQNKEAIITENKDYSKIYAIYSLDFFNTQPT